LVGNFLPAIVKTSSPPGPFLSRPAFCFEQSPNHLRVRITPLSSPFSPTISVPRSALPTTNLALPSLRVKPPPPDSLSLFSHFPHRHAVLFHFFFRGRYPFFIFAYSPLIPRLLSFSGRHHFFPHQNRPTAPRFQPSPQFCTPKWFIMPWALVFFSQLFLSLKAPLTPSHIVLFVLTPGTPLNFFVAVPLYPQFVESISFFLRK